jgi:DnaJ homolog subfamily C member 13
VQALVRRLMPVVFLQTLAEDAVRTVAIFDASHENPELIWNQSMRTELRQALSHLSTEALLTQQRDHAAAYALPADFKVEYPQLANLLCIGGVYISQLLKQPAWQLRDPRGFLEGLLHHWAQLVASGAQNAQLDEPSQALVVLLQANPALSPHVAAMGYLSKVLAAVASSDRADVQKASVSVVRVLSDSAEVVQAMRSLDCVTPLLTAMRNAPSTCTLLLPSLTCMAAAPEIVEKAVEAKLVPFVLGLLAGGLEQCDDPATVKAHAVKLLKTLSADVRLGPTIQQTLDAEAVWESYKAQEHDLFLQPDAERGLLTGGRPAGVGLLTSQ